MTKFGRQYISINVPTRNFGGIAPVIYADACEKNYNVSPTSVPENNHETNPTLDPNPNWGRYPGGKCLVTAYRRTVLRPLLNSRRRRYTDLIAVLILFLCRPIYVAVTSINKYQQSQRDPRDALSRAHTAVGLDFYTELDARCDKLAKVVGPTSTVASIVNSSLFDRQRSLLGVNLCQTTSWRRVPTLAMPWRNFSREEFV